MSQALELTSDKETTKEEQKILKEIVNFGNTDTKEVMCPRIDIFSLSKNIIQLSTLSNSELISMGLNGKKYSQLNFDRKKILDGLDNLFKSYIKK